MSAVHYPTDVLVSAIRQACEHVNPDHPARVSQRDFDRARGELGITCPRASDLAKRFDLPWRDLLEKANRDGDAFRTLRLAEKGYEPARANRDTCVAAVRLAADQLGQGTLLPREYQSQRNQTIARSRGNTRERLESRWPVLSQVQGFGWASVLAEAGLSEAPVNPRWGMDGTDLMEIFLECRGYVPTLKGARRFAACHGIALSYETSTTDEAFAELTARRAAAGKWTPHRPLIDRWAPDPTPETLAIEAESTEVLRAKFPSRPRNHWTEERIFDGLDFATRKLQPGKSLTQPNLRRLARENPGQVPSPSTVSEYAKRVGTSLPELREQALARVMNQ